MTSLRLSYIPIPESIHVYLNGIEVDRANWTYNSLNGSIVLSGAGEVSLDRFECRYAHQNIVPPVVTGTYVTVTGDHGTFTAGSATLITPIHSAGDLLVGIVVTNGVTVATPAGWTLVGSSAAQGRVYVFQKVGAGAVASSSDPGALGGLTWYEATTMVYRDGLSSVVDLVWGSRVTGLASGATVVTPGNGTGGRVLHLGVSDNPNAAWHEPAGYTRRYNHNWGNSQTHAVADWVGDGSPMAWTETSSGGFNALTATMTLA